MLRILVLGATSPIARALAARFAQAGAALYLAARDEPEAERIAADLRVRTGASVFAGRFEAHDFLSHESFLRAATAKLDGLDGLILCFGTLGDQDCSQRDPKRALGIIDANLSAAVSILTLAADRLEAQQSGFMIILGSVAGERGRAANYVYAAAKGALALFAQGLRARLSRTPIRVMTVKLGQVDTRMTYGRERLLMVAGPEQAARKIYAAWVRRADVVYVPWFWRPIMAAVRLIPERVFKRLDI